MRDVALWLVGPLGIALLALTLVHLRSLRLLAAARAEAQQLRDMVKRRVERPNVFSHEVRTPLTLIQGAGELLAEETPGPLTDRQREFVATITSNAQRVNDLAQMMLAEAKIDAQLFELRLEPVDLRQLVRQTVRDARRVHSTGLRIESIGPPLVLHADRHLLGQALWNLVNNSCRHAAPGTSVTVSVSHGEGQAVVAVSDDGAGMTDDERSRLFEPFASASGGTGTGLGMTITERIIEEHGGRMLVDTIPGRGTTVYFTIPLPDAERPRGAHD
ncbi:MAG: HAMP domain-containing histidine kinase [Propionibacteriaceae bacterium]|nr:HAMP domain-containing histidine kinase [Propionibacteriaceae bacterium]